MADIANVLKASMESPDPGAVYNVCDDEPAPPEDVIACAARLLGVPAPEAIPFEKAELSPMARSFYAESKRVSNRKMKAELGVTLEFPDFRSGLGGAPAGGGSRLTASMAGSCPSGRAVATCSDQLYLGSDCRQFEQLGDMLVVEADASTGRTPSDLFRIVRAVDPVKPPAQVEGMGAHGIVRAGRDVRRPLRITLEHGLRRAPVPVPPSCARSVFAPTA